MTRRTGMTQEQLNELWGLVAHQERCKMTMISPFEAECDCCDTILKNIFSAGAAAEREACAKLCEDTDYYARTGFEYAEDIRERVK